MSVERAWSCQELADHADNWSLAGNVALLKHIEQFAENMFRAAEKTNNNLESLQQDLDKTEIQLDLVKNQFRGLQNTQFIESRVYEDDETVAEEVAETPGTKLDDTMKRELLKNAVVDGLKVLDKYYEQVSIPESDSEGDETDCCSYVLREKDPYINRPLPYIIGTEEWHTKWHAGLAESSDEEGIDDEYGVKENGSSVRVEDEFSDTDDESHLPVADRRFESQEFNLTLNDNDVNHVEYGELNGNSVSAKTPITNATFAEQLAAKLGDVLTTPGVHTAQSDPEVNTRPIQRKQPSVPVGFLNDVPPDISEDTFGAPSQGLFSGGSGLFDDDDNFEKPPPITIPSNTATSKKRLPNLFDEDEEDDFFSGPPPNQSQFSSKPHPTLMQPTMTPSTQPDTHKKKVRSLFDESDEEEGGDFVVARNETNRYTKKDTGVLFPSNEPPSLGEAKKEEKKKTLGGVNVLGGFLPKKRVSSSSSEDISHDEDDKNGNGTVDKTLVPVLPVQNVKPVEQSAAELSVDNPPSLTSAGTSKTEKRVLSLFDDTDDLFEDDLFSSSTTAAVTSSKGITTNNSTRSSSKQKKLLFADEEDYAVGKKVDDSFHPPPLFSSSDQERNKQTKTRNLFDESSEEEDDMFAAIPTSHHFRIFGKEKEAEKSSLFGDFDDDNIVPQGVTVDVKRRDDKETVDVKNTVIIADIKVDRAVTNTETKDDAVKPRFSLFDDKPPSLDDDDWDDPPLSSIIATKEKSVDAPKGNQPEILFETGQTSSFGDKEGITGNTTIKIIEESSSDEGEQVEVKAAEVKTNEAHDIISDVKGINSTTQHIHDDKPPLPHEDDDWDDPLKVSQCLQIPSRMKEVGAEEEVEKVSGVIVKQEKGEEKSPEKKLPGRLKHHLNINVNALMPGAKMTKPQKSTNEEQDDDTAETKEEEPIYSKLDIIPASVIHELVAQTNPDDVAIEKKDPNQGQTEDINILTSVTKTRAKIPIKRHPSTRRGRKAALATSHNAEITLNTEVMANIEETDKSSNIKPVDIRPTEVTIDEVREVAEVPPLLKETENITSNIHPNFDIEVKPPLLSEGEEDIDIFDDFKLPTKRASLFDDSDDDDFTSGLSIPTKSTIPTSSSSSTPRKQLIVEDFDDDRLKPLPPGELQKVGIDKEMIQEKKEDNERLVKKISLFDDLDENQESDDLFSTHPKKIDVFQSPSSASLAKKKGVENVRVFDDILPTKPLVTKPLTTESIQSPTPSHDSKISNVKIDRFVESNKKETGLFSDGNEDGNVDLFADRKTKEASKVPGYNTSLFGDNDDDDDLFSDTILKKKAIQYKQLVTEQVKKQADKKNTSLFGDEDDTEEDIFGSTARTKTTIKKTNECLRSSGTQLKAASKKQSALLSTTSAKSDPLADLFGDSD